MRFPGIKSLGDKHNKPYVSTQLNWKGRKLKATGEGPAGHKASSAVGTRNGEHGPVWKVGSEDVGSESCCSILPCWGPQD